MSKITFQETSESYFFFLRAGIPKFSETSPAEVCILLVLANLSCYHDIINDDIFNASLRMKVLVVLLGNPFSYF